MILATSCTRVVAEVEDAARRHEQVGDRHERRRRRRARSSRRPSRGCRAAGRARAAAGAGPARGCHRRRQHGAHASALRPFIANRPEGFLWMKMTMKTSTTILASTAPATPSSSLLRTPRPSAGDDRAGELADAAEDDDQERVDDVALAEVGADVADLRERARRRGRRCRRRTRTRACRSAPCRRRRTTPCAGSA